METCAPSPSLASRFSVPSWSFCSLLFPFSPLPSYPNTLSHVLIRVERTGKQKNTRPLILHRNRWGRFLPDEKLMRAEEKFEAFLMNAAPLSAPLTTEQPILDIPTSAYFHGYVLCFSMLSMCVLMCVSWCANVCTKVCMPPPKKADAGQGDCATLFAQKNNCRHHRWKWSHSGSQCVCA
jgi:hypothetical protein